MRMNTKLKGGLLCSLLFFIVQISYAQHVVQGTVTDANNGLPLPGVNIIIKDTDKGTITDFNGKYKLNAGRKDATLIFQFIGYKPQEIALNGRTSIDLNLNEDLEELEEIVVIGYGTQRKKELTGAVSSVKSEDLLKNASSDVLQSIQGQIAGVNIQANGGAPGQGSNIQIRGVGSVTGSSEPLFVVDGIPYESNPNITPEEIASMEVLKDGAAASIYGTRASNGVILITTKKGEEGKMKVSFSSYYGVQNITSGTPLMSTREQLYAEKVTQTAAGNNPYSLYSNRNSLYNNTDFVGSITNNNATISNYNLRISGGQKDLTYNLVTTYFDQEGVLVNSAFDKFSTRATGTFKSGKFKAFASLGVTTSSTQVEPWALLQQAINQRPWGRPIEIADGETDLVVPGLNPDVLGGFARMLKEDHNRSDNRFNAALNLKYDIIPGLTYQVNMGGNMYNYFAKQFTPKYIIYGDDGEESSLGSNPLARMKETYRFSQRGTLENLLTYRKKFGKHNITALVGYTMESFTTRTSDATKLDFLSNDTQQFNAGSEAVAINGTSQEQTLTGKLARVMYNYKGKYLLSASVRQDGSSNFGSNNKYGIFKGFSAGWNVSEESFMKNTKSVISNLKLRASWAEVGNQNIKRYRYDTNIEPNLDYPFGGEGSETLSLGAAQKGFANPNIQWETNIATNIGIDLSLLDGKINIVADAYHNSKKDMLLDLELPPSTGTHVPRDYNGEFKSVTTNVGNMINKGVEVAVTYKHLSASSLKWNITGTFTKNINEITDLGGFGDRAFGGGQPILSRPNIENTTYLSEGYAAPSFFLIPTDGIIKTDAELEEYRQIIGSAQLGDLKYIDTNNDKQINDDDRVYMGSALPEFEAGLMLDAKYKGIDLMVQLYYSHGGKIYNGSKAYAYSAGRHKDIYYQWSPENADSDIPTKRLAPEHYNTRTFSDYFLEDGTYLRVKNISLGYTIPSSIMKKHINKLRIYANLQNPFTFTKYEGFDPEVGNNSLFLRGVDRGNYPVSRRILLGVQVDF